jgi:hypothetical protein
MKSDKAHKVVQSLSNELMRLEKLCYEQVLTRSEAREIHDQMIHDNELFKKLPQWAKTALYYLHDAIYWETDRRTVWTHCLNGERFIASKSSMNARKLTDDEYGEINKQNPNLGAHCFAVELDGRLILVPRDDEARERDLATGVLLQADLTAIKNDKHCREVVFLFPAINHTKIKTLV